MWLLPFRELLLHDHREINKYINRRNPGNIFYFYFQKAYKASQQMFSKMLSSQGTTKAAFRRIIVGSCSSCNFICDGAFKPWSHFYSRVIELTGPWSQSAFIAGTVFI